MDPTIREPQDFVVVSVKVSDMVTPPRKTWPG